MITVKHQTITSTAYLPDSRDINHSQQCYVIYRPSTHEVLVAVGDAFKWKSLTLIPNAVRIKCDRLYGWISDSNTRGRKHISPITSWLSRNKNEIEFVATTWAIEDCTLSYNMDFSDTIGLPAY